MIMKLFCFQDSVSQSFGPPLGAPNLNAFIRDTVQPQLEAPNSQIARNPSDFSIYQVAEMDTSTGEIKPVPLNSHGLVSDFKKA